jgi:hypothetical protein
VEIMIGDLVRAAMILLTGGDRSKPERIDPISRTFTPEFEAIIPGSGTILLGIQISNCLFFSVGPPRVLMLNLY